MAGMTRGSAGQPVVIAQPQTEWLPGLDRPTAVLWLGLSLVAANELAEGGPLPGVIAAAQGKPTHGDPTRLTQASLEVGLVGLFWIMARVSDSAGSLAILLLIGLWLVWLTTHVQNVAKALGHALPAPAQIPPVKPATK
jgi:hypothetical protein